MAISTNRFAFSNLWIQCISLKFVKNQENWKWEKKLEIWIKFGSNSLETRKEENMTGRNFLFALSRENYLHEWGFLFFLFFPIYLFSFKFTIEFVFVRCDDKIHDTWRQEKKSISNFSTHIILCTNQTKKLCRQWQEQERENCHTKSFRPILSLQRKKKNEQEFDDETMGFVTE